jgi:thiamine pyrophosphokinase
VSLHTTAIIANGQIDFPEIIKPLILRHSRVIAVDGGLAHCKRMGITPHLIVGDFDSCPPNLLNEYPKIPRVSLPTHKDQTDLEVAIDQAKNEKITLYGAWGHRIDHSLTNALLLCRFPGRMHMETEKELVFAINSHTQLDCFAGQTLSLIPLCGPVLGITTRGLKWELGKGKLDQNFIGISNICLEKRVDIRVERGTLLCCMIKEGCL